MIDSEAVALIQSLEPVFYEAGRLAVDLQRQAVSSMKSDTGKVAKDIVTSADLEVQEYVLTRLAKTPLARCQLLAEEDTPSTAAFDTNGTTVLSLDPISGTIRYAGGKGMFSIKVGLRTGSTFPYEFVHHPKERWTVVIRDGTLQTRGEAPLFALPNAAKLILTVNQPNDFQQDAPELFEQLNREGFVVKHQRDVTADVSASSLVLSDQIGGYYGRDPNVYDGFTAFTYAQAKGLEIHSTVDWTAVRGETGNQFYPGYYVVLNRPVTH